jgi:tagaturonate reductase
MTFPQLSPKLISESPDILPEYKNLSALPEKVIQFGTGVLLRGLPDYFIDKANRQGIFNGRIVVVKSTGKGDVDAFADQNNLFTHSIRGIEKGQPVEETFVNSSISRTLSAIENWGEVLDSTSNTALSVIISNTTEVGIQYIEDDLKASPPVSFPGKLTAFLYERFLRLGGESGSGFTIVPTELIPGNGEKLKDIVLQHVADHALGEEFENWIKNENQFCNSLVDRIVPGKPDQETLDSLKQQLGYTDDLIIMSEVYRLWAIEGDENVKSALSFARADKGVVIENDIDIYRELKLRLLNGTHTLCVGYCFLEGLDTVRESMDNPATGQFISDLMLNELAPSIPYHVELSTAHEFGAEVLDRFRNPFIRHNLIDITVQYTAKMKMRNIPTLIQHYKNGGNAPALFAKGFAAFLRFMKSVNESDGQYFGERNGIPYPIRCDAAAYFHGKWALFGDDTDAFVKNILSDAELWEHDLSALPGFEEAVSASLKTYF